MENNNCRYEKKINNIAKIITKLKEDPNFMDTVFKSCTQWFYDNKFIDKLNKNPWLLGFENGIYDLTTMSFRAGSPIDYVSFTVGYEYQEFPEKRDDDKIFNEIKDYFKMLHPDDETRNYLLTRMSSYLCGRKKDDTMFSWIGSDSGMTTAIKLLCNVLGDYFGMLPCRKFTEFCKYNPELENYQGKRISEFD